MKTYIKAAIMLVLWSILLPLFLWAPYLPAVCSGWLDKALPT